MEEAKLLQASQTIRKTLTFQRDSTSGRKLVEALTLE
jgi:hypothetical protein